jgi:uncharacterized membrane protein
VSWWRVFLARLARRIWFRAALFSGAAVALALAGRFIAPSLPIGIDNIGQDSVDSILTILASSMLAVTTFSLTAMVQAYSSATTLATPRATQLMIEDPTSQNALSTFLGGFLFAIVGIIALSAGFYGEQGRIFLFVGTIGVVALISMTLLRWIDHITGFGRMSDVIDRVEEAAIRGMESFATAPHLGARHAVPVPEEAVPIAATEAGYVIHVDVGALERAAEGGRLRVHVVALPGTLVHPGRALARIEGEFDEATADRLRSAFRVERHRVFGSDARLGLIALSEIASRALSPSTNDPGTAIEVLNALHRIFLVRFEPREIAESACRLVFVPTVPVLPMVEDAFRPIARDGAADVEVMIRLQKTLAAIAFSAGEAAPVFAGAAADAVARGEATLAHPADRKLLARTAREVWAPLRARSSSSR